MTEPPVEVHIVEDEPETRTSYCDSITVLCSGERATPVPHANGEAFQAMWPIEKPALLVIDVYLGGGINGVELTQWVRERDPDVPILIVTARPEWGIAEQTHRQVDNMLAKTSALDVIRAIETTLPRAREVANRQGRRVWLIEQVSAMPRSCQQVLAHLLAGATVKKAAEQVCIDKKTVYSHRKRIYRDFDVQSDVELVNLFHDVCKNSPETPVSFVERVIEEGNSEE